MQSIRCVLFDLDGTLVDGGPLRSALTATCDRIAERYPALDASAVLAANDSVWSEYWAEVQVPWTLGEVTGASVRAEAWRRTFAALETVDDGAAAFAEQTHKGFERSADLLFDDVEPMLAAIEDRGIVIGLISNGAADTQRDKIVHLGLDRRFAAIVVSGEEKVAKPDADIFEIALARLGATRSSTCHVGDSLASDVAGANAAGLASIWLNRSGRRRDPEEAEPAAEIHTLRALPALLTSAP